MFFDYDFRNYNFRLMTYMIALNVIGVLVVRSATNKDPDFVTKQMLGRFSRSCDRYRSFTDRLPQNIKSDCHYLPFYV